MRNCAKAAVILLVTTLATLGSARQEEGSKTKPNTKVVVTKIKPEIRYEFSRTVGRGRLVKAQNGVEGQVIRTYEVEESEGKEPSKKLVKTQRIEAKPTIILMGRDGYGQSRGSYVRSRVLTMHASAYDASKRTIGRHATGRTRMGIPANYGTVAVDRRVIPLGTRVFVEGYGYAIAADTGSAIKGNRIDLCFPKRSTALYFGRQTVRVHVLKPR
ncbi:MAG: 3D domain-containing protein [Fimbriimonas sp.]